MAPCVARPSATMVLSVQDDLIMRLQNQDLRDPWKWCLNVEGLNSTRSPNKFLTAPRYHTKSVVLHTMTFRSMTNRCSNLSQGFINLKLLIVHQWNAASWEICLGNHCVWSPVCCRAGNEESQTLVTFLRGSLLLTWINFTNPSMDK